MDGVQNEILKAAESMGKEEILKRVEYNVINRARNKEHLMECVHKDILDLSAVYKIVVRDNGINAIGFDLTYGQCDEHGISMDELDAAARRNAENIGFMVKTLGETMAELTGVPASIYDREEPLMHIMTMKNRRGGPNIMFFKEYFDELADKFDDDLYVLPSSIHELIVIPVAGMRGKKDIGEIKSVVMGANRDIVDDTDYLSDNVYVYRRKERELAIPVKLK